MGGWVGGWVTGAGESGVGEVLVATSLIARSQFWFKFQMEFVFWDCGSTQVAVAKQSGEVCIVYGNEAAERVRGDPWEFRDGLLHRSAETVCPADLFTWALSSGDNTALSLKHRTSEVAFLLSVAQNMFEGRVLKLPVPPAASSSSNEPFLSSFECEAYWTTAPTVLADGEPLSLWVSLASVMKFIYSNKDNKNRKCHDSFESWRRALQHYGLDPDHAQRSSASKKCG